MIAICLGIGNTKRALCEWTTEEYVWSNDMDLSVVTIYIVS